MSEFDFVNFNSRLIDFLETYEELIFFGTMNLAGRGFPVNGLFFSSMNDMKMI
jgi:hypothetical protein